MALPIAQLGQPVLRRVAAEIPIGDIKTPSFQQFVDDMLAAVAEHQGAGLAGPQVFAERRIFVAKVLSSNQQETERELEVFINPRISALTKEPVLAWEGCLSFPELLVLVPRVGRVRLDYLNRHAEPRTLELEAWPARIVQHEYDHLQGILTLDRAPSPRYIIKASEIEAAVKELEETG
jgi:peptide deformylase